jgi:hypothetical protein
MKSRPNSNSGPEIVWEAFLGIYLTFWGFRRRSPVLGGHGTGAAVATM